MGSRTLLSVSWLLALALAACDPWWAHSIRIDGTLLFIDDPSTPEQGCNNGAALTMTVNGEVLPPASGTHEDCIQGFCVCVAPSWLLEPVVLMPERDDGQLILSLSDGETTRELRTEDPWIEPPVLVGDPRLRRGEERRLDWFSETPPSADDWWDFSVSANCPREPCGGTQLFYRCAESIPGCDASQDIDRARVRFEGNAMFFTVPNDVPTGPGELHLSRTFLPNHLECGFGRCDVLLFDGGSFPVTVE